MLPQWYLWVRVTWPWNRRRYLTFGWAHEGSRLPNLRRCSGIYLYWKKLWICLRLTPKEDMLSSGWRKARNVVIVLEVTVALNKVFGGPSNTQKVIASLPNKLRFMMVVLKLTQGETAHLKIGVGFVSCAVRMRTTLLRWPQSLGHWHSECAWADGFTLWYKCGESSSAQCQISEPQHRTPARGKGWPHYDPIHAASLCLFLKVCCTVNDDNRRQCHQWKGDTVVLFIAALRISALRRGNTGLSSRSNLKENVEKGIGWIWGWV